MIISGTLKAFATVDAQIAKEASERRRATQNNNSAKAVGSNLTQQGNGRTAEVIAKKMGVSKNTYKGMKQIVNEGTAEQIERTSPDTNQYTERFTSNLTEGSKRERGHT